MTGRLVGVAWLLLGGLWGCQPEEADERASAGGSAAAAVEEAIAALPEKRARFVREYLIDLNGTQAAIRAGYSPRSAFVQACNLLKDHKVARAVAAGARRKSDELQVTQDDVIRELAKLAFASMGDFLRITADGDPVLDLSKATPDQLAALSAIAGALAYGTVGAYALVTPFANEIMSGWTPSVWMPNQSPHRPNPVMTSSAMSRTSYSSQISRTRGK